MDFEKVIRERYACRAFLDELIPEEKIREILEAAHMAPTAKNLQPQKIFVIQSEAACEVIREATPCSYGARQFFLVGYDREQAWIRSFDERNFGVVDASIVATHLVLAIENAGLESCWVGHFDPAVIREKLPSLAAYDFVAIFPFGHAAPEGGPSERHEQRRPSSDCVEFI
ncbi:MAG: nitroreductase family protein [Eubacteriales bacterium]|nr:nitroreductase family protein [Eubacteriales bacterium]